MTQFKLNKSWIKIFTSDYVSACVDPLAKYFAETHDAARLDREENMDDETMKNLREIGAFGVELKKFTNLEEIY